MEATTSFFKSILGIKPSRKKSRFFVVGLLIVAVTVTVYIGVTGNEFVYYDDNVYVTENSHIRQGLTWEGIKWSFTSFYASNWHPLSWISHMLDIQMFGMNPAGHHCMNLFYHLISTMLLFGFFCSTIKNIWAGAFVAALFALHPLHVESVAWVAERKDVLSAVFWFATMWAYANYCRRTTINRYLLVLALFTAGLLAKPMLVTLPLVLLLLDYWPLARFENKAGTVRRLIAEKVPLLALALVSAFITIKAQQAAIASLTSLPLATRLANAIVSYVVYLRQTIFPAGLSVFYPHPHQTAFLDVFISSSVIAAVTVIALLNSSKRKYLLTGWFWYLITLIPVIGIIQVGDQAHADRYTYIPLVGIFVIAALIGEEIARSKPAYRKFVVAAGLTIIVVSGCITMRTVRYWNNDLELFGHAVKVTRDNAPMMMKLGDALLALGRVDEAQMLLEKSHAIKPSDYAYAVRGSIHQRRGELDKAIQNYQMALTMNPNGISTLINAGSAYLVKGNYAEAEKVLQRAIQLDPENAPALSFLGRTLCARGEFDPGVEYLQKAIDIDPRNASYYNALGIVYTQRENYAQAAEQFKKSNNLQKHHFTLNNLGACLAASGKKDEAVKAYKESLTINPADFRIRYDLAKVLIDMDRKAEALEQLQQAMAIAPQDTAVKNACAGLAGDMKQFLP